MAPALSYSSNLIQSRLHLTVIHLTVLECPQYDQNIPQQMSILPSKYYGKGHFLEGITGAKKNVKDPLSVHYFKKNYALSILNK